MNHSVEAYEHSNGIVMEILENVNEYVGFLIKNELSTNQFLLLYLMYTERMAKDSKGNLKYTTLGNIYKWSEKGTGWTEKEVIDLIDKDFIVNVSKENYSIDRLVLTSKFSEIMFVDANFAFQEFFEAYPPSIKIDGETAFIKAVDPNSVALLYNKVIKGSLSVHKDIMSALEYGIPRGLIKMRIDKFIHSRLWVEINKMKEEEGEGYGKEIY